MVYIEIDDPENAIRYIEQLVATTPENYEWKVKLRQRIGRALLHDLYVNVWRPVESFPDYEMSGGGIIRNIRTREHVSVTVTSSDPVMVSLDDSNGWACDVHLDTLILDNFPEYKE